jgi:hypothetical protein
MVAVELLGVTMTTKPDSERFTVYLGPTERKRLTAIQKHYGFPSLAVALRYAVTRQLARRPRKLQETDDRGYRTKFHLWLSAKARREIKRLRRLTDLTKNDAIRLALQEESSRISA